MGGKQLEALSIQLVILAIWKQALHICHTHAASAVEGSPGQDTRLREAFKAEHSLDVQDSFDITKPQGTQELCSEIERTFLHEVENAEGLVKGVESGMHLITSRTFINSERFFYIHAVTQYAHMMFEIKA